MKNNVIYKAIIIISFSIILQSCSIVKLSEHEPRLENDDVVVYNLPSKGILDVSRQNVELKRGALQHKKINEIIFDICKDFEWFQPFTIMGIYKVETKMSIGPSYVYYPQHKKERAKVVNIQTRESYYFDKDWCKK